MAMNVGAADSGKDPEVMIDINTTPLIDVMLVLLIMLIINIPMQTHAVKLNMPVNQAQNRRRRRWWSASTSISTATILWDGQVIPDKQTLESKFQQIAQLDDQPEVHLRPNKLVTYKYVAMVMASAQRLGVAKIGLVGNENSCNDNETPVCDSPSIRFPRRSDRAHRPVGFDCPCRWTVRPELGKPLQAAQDLIKTRKYQER